MSVMLYCFYGLAVGYRIVFAHTDSHASNATGLRLHEGGYMPAALWSKAAAPELRGGAATA